jgi:hypothetical protein
MIFNVGGSGPPRPVPRDTRADIPIVGTLGLAVLLTGAILLGIGLWRRSLYVAGFVVAIAGALIAAAPWLPYVHRHVFSWLENTRVTENVTAPG